MSVLSEYKYKASALNNADWQEVADRLAAFVDWMETQAEIKTILADLKACSNGPQLLAQGTGMAPPKAKTMEEIAAVGLALIEECKKSGIALARVASSHGIRANGNDRGNYPAISESALKRFIEPFLNYVIRKLPAEPESVPSTVQQAVPVAIQESLKHFQNEHPDPRKVCFVMMQFGKTTAHEEIE